MSSIHVGSASADDGIVGEPPREPEPSLPARYINIDLPDLPGSEYLEIIETDESQDERVLPPPVEVAVNQYDSLDPQDVDRVLIQQPPVYFRLAAANILSSTPTTSKRAGSMPLLTRLNL